MRAKRKTVQRIMHGFIFGHKSQYCGIVERNRMKSNFDLETPINQLTHKIIGCAMEVHNRLGCGFQEVIYQRALSIEMSSQGLKYAREQDIPIFYRTQSIGTRRADFFVDGKVLIEIKAVENLLDVHKAQAINYCEAFEIPHGLLLNFGSKSLQFHRLYNKNFVDSGVNKISGRIDRQDRNKIIRYADRQDRQ